MLLCSGFDQAGSSAHHNEGQKIPILRVPVGDESDARVLKDVPDAFEAARGYFFGFLVEGDVDPAPVEGVADWDRVRLPRGCSGSKPGDPLSDEEGGLLGRENSRFGTHAAIRWLHCCHDSCRKVYRLSELSGSHVRRHSWRAEVHKGKSI